MKRSTRARAVAAGLLLLSTSASALDGERRGFLVGVGIGTQSTDATMDMDNGFERFEGDVSESGTALSFRIGGGLSDRSTLYVTRRHNFGEDDVSYGLTGIGASYYFTTSGPSFYVHGGLGAGEISFGGPDEGIGDGRGRAAMFGAGMETARGLHVEMTFMNVQASGTVDIPGSGIDPLDVDYDIGTTQFTIGYTWF